MSLEPFLKEDTGRVLLMEVIVVKTQEEGH